MELMYPQASFLILILFFLWVLIALFVWKGKIKNLNFDFKENKK